MQKKYFAILKRPTMCYPMLMKKEDTMKSARQCKTDWPQMDRKWDSTYLFESEISAYRISTSSIERCFPENSRRNSEKRRQRVYRQLGDSNSQWHKKIAKSASWGKCQLGEVLVGGKASWGKCHLGEVPLGGQVPVGGQNFNPWTDDFFPIL